MNNVMPKNFFISELILKHFYILLDPTAWAKLFSDSLKLLIL